MIERVEKYINENNKYIKILSISAIIIGSFIAIAQGFQFIKSNFWKPKITIVDVDFEKAIAHMIVNGANRVLYGDATIAAGSDWGVQFGTTNAGTDQEYDTLQTVKNGMVYEILKTKAA